jgi:hypothetical protein
VGDRIYHKNRRGWGIGKVVEVKTSVLDGGPALVRITFQDGRDRTFFNDLEDSMCCYYSGVRVYDH